MQIDLQKIKKIHFIGVGGIGISAIARMTALEGKIVVANDIEEFEMVSELRKFGVDTKIGKDENMIESDTDLYVYSIAWDTIGPEFLALARATGKPVLTYPEMLHIVTEGKYTIAVAGTHGKTTTTAMIAEMLIDLKKDPSVIVGSVLLREKSNVVIGKSEYFVVEACEYRRSFLNISPKVLVITNIEPDHLDYYKDMKDIEHAFSEFIAKLPADGVLIVNEEEIAERKIIQDAIEKAQVRGVMVLNSMDMLADVGELRAPGEHNRKNAASAMAVASALQIPVAEAAESLSHFTGTWRRFEYKGEMQNGTKIYDDYAHHPTEIQATLAGAKELFVGKKIIVAFQPHLFSRTKSLFKEFSESFKNADVVLLLPIYKAREEDDGTVSSHMLAQAIEKNGTKAYFMPDFDKAEAYIREHAKTEDVVFTMGAGDVYHIGEKLLS